MERALIVIGLAIAAAGLLWPWLTKLGLGRLPGDIYVRGEHGSFYFPVTTCILRQRRAVARHLADKSLSAGGHRWSRPVDRKARWRHNPRSGSAPARLRAGARGGDILSF